LNISKPRNENYAAVITRVPAVVPLLGRDRIVAVPLFGHQAIVQKGWETGDLGVFFPAETQLSEGYAAANNMHKHADKNADPAQVGYLEDNRRIKALKLGGHRSDAIFMPLKSLAYTGIDVSQLREGDIFDRIGDHEICQKYEIVQPKQASTKGNHAPKPRRVMDRHFPLHLDTSNYWRAKHTIADSDFVWVTQKLHGTSVRIGRTIVARKLTRLERVARKLGVNVQETAYDNVYGSRRVTKDVNDPDQNHYYDTDIWTIEGRKLDGLVPAGYVVYGELIGWTPDGVAIQKGYTYHLPQGEAKLYVYRVATVNPDGVSVDLSWPQVEEFCRQTGLNPAPLLWAGYHEDFDVDAWMDQRYRDVGYRNAVALDPGKTVDEGVVVRVDGLTPRLYKAKSPAFLQYETKILDAGVADLESAEAAA